MSDLDPVQQQNLDPMQQLHLDQMQRLNLDQMRQALRERGLEVEQALLILRDLSAREIAKQRETLQILAQVQAWKGYLIPPQQQFMQTYSARLGARLGLNEGSLRDLAGAVPIYRLGMLGLPDALVQKPFFELDADQRALYERYPALSEQALASACWLRAVAPLVRHQREWINGRGHPDGWSDAQIPVGSKIIGVLDQYYEAWRGRLVLGCSGKRAAAEYLMDWIGKRFDGQIVQMVLEEVADFNDPCVCTVVLTAAQLEPGMVLVNDVAGDNGGALLVAGTKLTETHLRALQKHAAHLHHELHIAVQSACAP